MTTTTDVPQTVPFLQRVIALRWDNWPGSLIVFVIGMALAIAFLPPQVSFWASSALAALFAVTLIANAWGKYIGGLLVTPALTLLFLMNVFPLLWSFGLSFFSYKANRARAPTWVGLDNYAKVLTDTDVWDRLHNTIILVIMTVSVQMVVGFLLALLFAKQFPLRRYLLILVLTPMMLSFVAVFPVRAELPADRRDRGRYDGRRRGARALGASGARLDRPGRLHPGRRGVRLDPRDRSLGAEPGMPQVRSGTASSPSDRSR